MAIQRWSVYLLFSVLLGTAPAYAHLPELYGRDYLRVFDPDTFQPPRSSMRKRVFSLRDSKEREYKQHIQAVQVERGPYHQGLTDPLTNLAHHHLEMGDIDEAIRSLRQAMHLVRINDGLNSQRQLPLLRQLIGLYREKADYAELGGLYAYYYRVSELYETPLPVDRLAQALEYLAWERQLYASRADGLERGHLVRAYEINKAMLEAAADAEPRVYLALAMSQMRNLYLILGDDPLEMVISTDPGKAHTQEMHLSGIQKMAYSKGKVLLEECIRRAAQTSTTELAEVHRELGDWLHWNGQLSRARAQYAEVIRLMEQAGEQELLAQWFDEPVELPDESDLWPLLHEVNGKEPRLIKASYEVNRQGESRRLEVSVDDEESQWQARRIRSMLKDTHFRPRIGKDGPESGPRVTRHYRLIAIH